MSKDCKSKLKKENAYNFAVCFICKEEGHLAKACPDNPKGTYLRVFIKASSKQLVNDCFDFLTHKTQKHIIYSLR